MDLRIFGLRVEFLAEIQLKHHEGENVEQSLPSPQTNLGSSVDSNVTENSDMDGRQ